MAKTGIGRHAGPGCAKVGREGVVMARCLVIGVDGSPASRAGVAWAARYASTRDLSVVATHVLTFSEEFMRDLPPSGLTSWRTRLRDRLEQDWTQAARDMGVGIRPELVEADRVDEGLLKVAADNDAELIVVGAHGHDDLADRLLGGAAHRLSHRADRPVVIVPADWHDPPGQGADEGT